MSRRRRWLLILAGVFLILLLIDAQGVFDDSPYFEVPHGNHVHYVPKDRDPNVDLDAFPTRPPGPGERITPQGQIVRE